MSPMQVEIQPKSSFVFKYLCCSDVIICVVRLLLFVLFGCYYLCCSVVICVVLCSVCV
jgi:hypothetical protein